MAVIRCIFVQSKKGSSDLTFIEEKTVALKEKHEGQTEDFQRENRQRLGDLKLCYLDRLL